VAPGKHRPFDLDELFNEGYRILVIVQTTNDFVSQLPYLLDEFDKFNVTFDLSLVESPNMENMNHPRTFAEEIFVFFISTVNGEDFIKQGIKSKVPEHCICTRISNDFCQFPVYTFFHHKLTYRIVKSVQLLTEAGLHNFFDRDLGRLAPDFYSRSIRVVTRIKRHLCDEC
jgi:hypothetical protein